MKRLSIILFLAAMTILTSCLKDGKVNLAPGASPPVIQWSTAPIDDAPANSASASYRLYVRAFPIVPTAQMDLQIGLTGTDPAPSDITVGLGVDAAAYNTFTSGGSTSTPMLPTNMYTMPTSVTIPKGSYYAKVSLTVNPALFDLSKSYYLPVAIKSTTYGGISGNYGTVIYQVSAKNKYDGVWNMTGTLVDLSTNTIVGKYPQKVYLETTGPSSVVMYDYLSIGNFAHAITSGTSTSSYGSFSPIFTFDASNNVTSVVNYYGQPSSNGRSGALDPTGTNKFTSGTPGTVGATFQVSYFMNQPSVVPVGPRTTFNETFTYVGARP